jgi:outer membrane phospholipase A
MVTEAVHKYEKNKAYIQIDLLQSKYISENGNLILGFSYHFTNFVIICIL